MPLPPLLSVAAFQLSEMLLAVLEGEVSPVGTLGAVVSEEADVVTLIDALCAEALPALSRARTVNV
jgi:hypothetical protein